MAIHPGSPSGAPERGGLVLSPLRHWRVQARHGYAKESGDARAEKEKGLAKASPLCLSYLVVRSASCLFLVAFGKHGAMGNAESTCSPFLALSVDVESL